MLRRISPVLLLLLLSVPGSLAAQYFGRNKVQYAAFDFKIIQTEHFDVYYYDRERVAALDAARMAERGYARLSKVLNHEFKERKPIILYASSADFQQTNATDAGGESTGGVTDFARNRAVMPFRIVQRLRARPAARNGAPVSVRHLVAGPRRRRSPDTDRHRATALVRRGNGRVSVTGADQSRDGDVAA